MTRFEVDPAATRVWIEARSTLHPIRSESRGLTGHFTGEFDAGGALDLDHPPHALLELPLDALSSGNPLYDREMRRRVDAGQHPVIAAELTSLRAGSARRSFEAEGSLTFHGVTRQVDGEVTISPEPEETGEETIVVEGSHVFDVRDFGVEPPRIMMLRVFPEVTVRVRIVARGPSAAV